MDDRTLRELARLYDETRQRIERTMEEWRRLVGHGDYTPERLRAQAQALEVVSDLAQAGAQLAHAIARGMPQAQLVAELAVARAERKKAYWLMTLLSDRKADTLTKGWSPEAREQHWQQARAMYVEATERVRQIESQMRSMGMQPPKRIQQRVRAEALER